jgi:muramidase (phage lysozyme)
MPGNRQAFLDMLAWSEGTSTIPGSDNGYNVLVGSTPQHPLLFHSYADHPRIFNPKLDSTAAGRYQLLAKYYDAYKEMLGVPDFSPVSQDAIAIRQLSERRALADIDTGKLQSAILKCSTIWASLPGSPYGQRQNSLSDLQDVYLKAGGRLTSNFQGQPADRLRGAGSGLLLTRRDGEKNMGIFQNVGQFFENLWTTVLKPDVQKAGQVIATFFGSAESAVEDELGVEGLKIVTDAVTAAEQAGGTGLQKLAAAKASIASNLSTATIINVAQNTINVAIEAAVAQMNAAQAQGGTSAITGIGSAS